MRYAFSLPESFDFTGQIYASQCELAAGFAEWRGRTDGLVVRAAGSTQSRP